MTNFDLEHVLILIGEAHKANTTQALRQRTIYGVGALIESVSCAWTELDVDLFKAKFATTHLADITDDQIDVPSALTLFNQYAWQHPVITHFISTGSVEAISISDIQNRTEFNKLELYRILFKNLSVEDQLSIGYIENGMVTGLSVNRATWGFSTKERSMLTHIARCVFPFYRILQRSTGVDAEQQSLVEINTYNISMHYENIGITPRQAELLTLVAYGMSNKQIAGACNISEGTVKKHLENVFRRLGVSNRISAITKTIKIIKDIGA